MCRRVPLKTIKGVLRESLFSSETISNLVPAALSHRSPIACHTGSTPRRSRMTERGQASVPLHQLWLVPYLPISQGIRT